MPTILDFQIQPLSTESYSLTVCERGASQPLATATFNHRVDFLTDFSVDRLNAPNSLTNDAADRFDELQKLGRELYQKLFSPAVEQVWHEYKERSEFLVLCLRFDEGAKRLEVLPWETLHDGTEFIAAGAETTLTRLPLDVSPPGELPLIPQPLKLFGFFASPLDLGDHERLNAEREQEILLEAINDPAAEGRISADFEDEAKLEILARSLLGGYHILHFTGHGISPRDGGGLLLEDAQGKKLSASIADVMKAVASGVDKLRLAVISGCQTARTLHTGAFNDLARELLRRRVPAVIAMQFSITDEGGLKFAEVLYREIAKGVDLERAVRTARCALLKYRSDPPKPSDFSINNDALAIVLLTADGACLQTTEAEAAPPQAESGATCLGDRLDPLAYGFYGRRHEYRKIRDALLHEDQPAVIIHGIGGIGKTALLTHAINRLRPHFKDVMSFDCRRAALAPETILLELHRYFETQGMPQLQSLMGQDVPLETLAEAIAKLLTEWPLLIVFDNFESQVDEQREFINQDLRVFLATLLRATAKGSRFLFTTRYLFNLDGERLGNVQELPLGDLSRSEALMLMQKLPNLAQSAHRDKLAVLEKFGGHPYALVTLDRHCSHQPLDQALQDASSLESELREFLAIELSYRQLSNRARELINRLGGFRQAVPLAAAEWVMGEKIPLPHEVLQWFLSEFLPTLDRNNLPRNWREIDDISLAEKLLPERRQVESLGQPIADLVKSGLLMPLYDGNELRSFVVHNLVRQFCADQQARETWRARLHDAATYYTNQTKHLQPYDKTLEMVLSDMEAFELLMEAEDFIYADAILSNTTLPLYRWGLWTYLKGQYNRLLDKMDQREGARVRHNLGMILQGLGAYGKAMEQYEASRRMGEELRDYVGVSQTLLQMGNLHYFCGEYDEAMGRYKEVQKISEDLGDMRRVTKALHNIGTINQERGEYEEAMRNYEEALIVSEDLGELETVAGVKHQMGLLLYRRGEYEEALKYYQASLHISKELGIRDNVANTLQEIGTVFLKRSEYDEAMKHYEASLRINEELENLAGIAGLLHQIGKVHQANNNYGEALKMAEDSLRIRIKMDDHMGAAISQNLIGAVLTRVGRYLEAFEYLCSALFTFINLRSPNAGFTANDLKKLRGLWGQNNFDEAWQQTTNKSVPEWLK